MAWIHCSCRLLVESAADERHDNDMLARRKIRAPLVPVQQQQLLHQHQHQLHSFGKHNVEHNAKQNGQCK